jgi:manganese-transporting P-type ATPase
LVAECPLKPDTAKVITELKNSSHEVKMITGDNQLTAAFIAQQLTFGNGQSLFTTLCDPAKSLLVWNDIDDKEVKRTTTVEEVKQMSKKHLLCISGEHLENLISFADA